MLTWIVECFNRRNTMIDSLEIFTISLHKLLLYIRGAQCIQNWCHIHCECTRYCALAIFMSSIFRCIQKSMTYTLRVHNTYKNRWRLYYECTKNTYDIPAHPGRLLDNGWRHHSVWCPRYRALTGTGTLPEDRLKQELTCTMMKLGQNVGNRVKMSEIRSKCRKSSQNVKGVGPWLSWVCTRLV